MGYTKCSISALALAKMSRQAARGGANEVMGLVTGITTESEFVVKDAFALPVEATETRVNAMGEAYAYIVQYMDAAKRSGNAEGNQVIGWYHSHPGYGCFLSQIDIDTQAQNQKFQDPFVAIVIDPTKTAQDGTTSIGCFRTNSPTSFYTLETRFFTNPWDEPLTTMLSNKTWSKVLSQQILD